MLDEPFLAVGGGAAEVDRSPVFVVDADRVVATTTELVPSFVARRHVVVGLCQEKPADERLMQVLDVAIAPLGSGAAAHPGVVEVADVDAALRVLLAAGERNPDAVWALARLLRLTETLPVEAGLVAESATYSALLGGAEFRSWLASRGQPRAAEDGDRVQVERSGDLVTITLARPLRRNAYDAHMRDALLEALEIAVLDPSVRVHLRGEGPDYCAGGDLDEFGTASDLGFAHRLRVSANPGLVVDEMRHRVTAYVHGNTIGSGIEVAAFAGTVVAAGDTRLRLPELGMGLIPGAGGTVSLTRRIGRHRVLWWAMAGERIGVDTARRWGLVDDVTS
ncbi:enoyl-CoA hydratase/isomerase family protein [Nocardioides sp. IC4_145]|uniref:enoyl-CoA hydratase/isomerase family protein n=1 Tax=Nocardioides sp. IC4_145 TaxID=2714037 RepID=UPI00140E69EA|nr:enoyl-CoA hydratase/isomerase family protein [Nocardioides sp. IC4_145]NHC21875.1 enoyl-CoA hydratase/isomerase family protein [Nocardioides sp. IC4_145]